ncbi:RagB/SusD family nutrient uptake outer membrane protein [Flavisolibacter ginsenosidimutans]|uniref:RagB/SusD family nutrient uptake outer membrane protein n=1 Tax=Flavisolibacter ginsenosidimutans TaxID=661481 RepID=A0A5B8UJ18_9BACT|nr:RagB/SusD family nutrient uptake outer membrane protein [Flavisolibacter ginsenosidimutans]QEC56691.1 RagB/SusD family nutrient uptake outer membrane protein [Flavisolibacter ginsenosidimutans]
MKYTNIYIINLFCFCLLLVFLTLFSCRKSLQTDLPIDKMTATAVFSTDEGATSAVLGIYSAMMPTLPYYSAGGTSIYGGLMSDELSLTSTLDPEEAEFDAAKLTPANGIVLSNFWNWAYKMIYGANASIEGITASEKLTPAVKARLLGEAKFIRAWNYFYLVNLFGDVPLVLSTAYKESATIPRSATAAVYDQILADLQEAKSLLPAAYAGTARIRPNRWAAVALLARVRLYRQAWAAAEAEATEVIGAGTYSLAPNPAATFLAGSNETLWALSPVESGFNTTEARYFIPTTSATTKPAYAVNPALAAAFESGDTRKGAWLGSKTVAAQTFYYPYKYKVYNLNLPVTETYTVLRYAEVLLVRAEARAQQDNLAGAKADLNAVRSRAALPPATATDKAALLAAIEKERRIEFFAEWAHRWFDLKRWGRLEPVMTAAKPGWQPYAALFPVPQAELLKNPSLTQNPGY